MSIESSFSMRTQKCDFCSNDADYCFFFYEDWFIERHFNFLFLCDSHRDKFVRLGRAEQKAILRRRITL
jgi:hypothetical protein